MSNQQQPDKKKSALDEWLSRKKKTQTKKGIAPIPEGGPALLSHGQERLWLLDQLYPDKALYNYAHRYRFTGALDIDRLIQAFQHLAKRHQVILSNYELGENATIQRVVQSALPVSHTDLSNFTTEQQKDSLVSQRSILVTKPFNLADEALLRLHVFKLNEECFEVLVVLHHILGDAWSMGIINQEVSEIYQALSAQREITLEPLKIQYKDYAYWQRQQSVKESDLSYWKNNLSGELPVFNLPKQSHNGGNFQGKVFKKLVDSTLSAALNELAKKHSTTMYVLMLTAYKLLLSRYSQQTDIVVGSPFSNRDTPQLEKLIGFFNETLVLRTAVDDTLVFGKLVERVKQTTLDALSHKNIPFDTLVNEIKPARQAGENPLFQTMFLYNPVPLKLNLGEAITVEEEMLDLNISKFDLTLFANETDHGLELAFEYNTQVESWVIESMADHFEALLNDIVEKPEIPVAQLSVYSADMQRDLTSHWQGKPTDLPNWKSIQELIVTHVTSGPNTRAVVFGDTHISYGQLDQWSEQVAQQLQEQGVNKNQFVGLFTPRSLEMVVGILGILKAGAAYLPLDPDYPQERLDFMLSDSEAEFLLYHPDLADQPTSKGKKAIPIVYDSLPIEISTEFKNQLDDYAYVIYTSGSTGKPKAVPVTHRNLIHSTTARFDFFEDPMRSFLLLSSFSFDSSIVGIFWSLCAGGTLVLPPKRIEQDIEGLSTIIEQQQVTHTLMLPSLYQVLLNFVEAKRLASLSAVIVAGEACSQGLKSTHFTQLPNTRLYNEYGPTEASVWCIAHEIKPEDQVIPIGRPITNTSAYLLDQNLQAVPSGTEGELYIGGLGVTNGYLNRPELTEERFISNPYGQQGEKIYRTGDLSRFRQDGVMLFLGRADQQVKIRGFRVEPEEIRNRILEEEAVSEAVVKVLEDETGNKQLIAWVQSLDSDLESTLRQNLKMKLPEYMVPAGISIMEVLPKLPNGKVDASQLTTTVSSPASEQTYIAPSNKKEELLTTIWQETLKIETIGIDDNFFDIGGDSILSIQIVAKARQAGIKIGPTAIFTHQHIRALAQHVSFLTDEVEEAIETYPIEFPLGFQQQAFLLHSLQSKNDQGILQLEFKIKGNVRPNLMEQAWQKVAELHPIMRTSFHWEDTDTPFQRIDEQVKIDWNYIDSAIAISDFKEMDLAKALDLREAGGGRITLIKTGENEFSLLWTCHHILADGWSGAIVFKDALDYYQGLSNNEIIKLSHVPNYKQFLDWKADQNEATAKVYWQGMLSESHVPLFAEQAKMEKPAHGFKDLSFHTTTTLTDTLHQKAQAERLTINTLFQGLWMLTLSSYFGERSVSTGLTVTGRACDFMGIDRITGLLMNVLPFKQAIEPSEKLATWFHSLQNNLNELRQFEHTDPDQIQAWADNDNRPFFDNLFVFGNFMSEQIQSGDLEVEEYKGDFSATFPLTLRVNPGRLFEVNCRYDSAIIPDAVAEWLMHSYESLLEAILSDSALTQPVEFFLEEKPVGLYEEAIPSDSQPNKVVTEFSGAENATQLELLKVFEKVLGKQLIGIHDNYFELGGTSLGAIRLVSEIDKAFDKKLSATTLISKPTVAQLATLLSEGEEEIWSSIIPMKTSGELPPLFCLHSGGAHVLFYQGLAKHLSADRPVYAIQPTGIDGEEEYHSSISEMATHYIAEMRKVQPQGPYHLIGTCFGNAVGIEMAHQLKAMGQELAVLYVVDSAPAYIVPPSPNGERKPMSRMLHMVKDGNWQGIVKKFRNRYIRLDKKLKASSRSDQEIELDEIVDSLNDVYVNYTWKPIEDKIVLIRSTEFSQRKDKGFHLKRWQFLAGQQLEVCEVEGHHLTLFKEPEVGGLTKAIEAHLSQLQH